MREFFSLYGSRNMLTVLILGFASGLPLALSGGTLQAWMTDEGIDVKTIGVLSLMGLPYNFKFLWSPLIDRFVPPFLGRRRGWILITQILLAAVICGIAALSPTKAPLLFVVFALSIAFFSASQDIVIDAYRTELLAEAERGPGAAVTILGYRLAMITSGALALIYADRLSWPTIYVLLSGLMAALSFFTFFCPEPSGEVRPPRSLTDAVVLPLKNFFERAHAVEILAFIILYKLGDVMAVALTTKFMRDVGFSNAEIGYVAKGLGLVCSIVGSLLGGGCVVKWGLRKSLFLFGLLQGLSILCFGVLSIVGKQYLVMSLAIGLENFCNGLGNAALITFLMGLCDKRYTATQFSLLTSAQSLSRTFAASITGFIVAAVGWTQFFVICTAFAIPGLVLLLSRYEVWEIEKNQSKE